MSQERLSSALAHMAELATSIKQDRDSANKMLKLLQKVPSSPEESASSEANLRRLLGTPEEIQDIRVRDAAAELLDALDDYLEDSRRSFLREFRDRAKKRGIEAQLSDSVFFAMGLRVVPNLAKGRCELRFGDEVVEKDLSLDADRCLDALTKQSKRLIDGRESPGKILAALHHSYLGACGQRQIAVGKYAPIIDVLNLMVLRRQSPQFFRDPAATRFSDYTRADFSADLFLLGSSSSLELKGKRLQLQTAVIDTARNRARSISVPSENGRSMTYYQALAFRPGRGGQQ